MNYRRILNAFTGEFSVKTRPVGDENIIAHGLQTGTQINNCKGVMALYTANHADGLSPPVRMQGILTYNSELSRFEWGWAGSNVEGLVYYTGQQNDEKLVLIQVTPETNKRMLTVELINANSFKILLTPGISDPQQSSLSEFSKL